MDNWIKRIPFIFIVALIGYTILVIILACIFLDIKTFGDMLSHINSVSFYTGLSFMVIVLWDRILSKRGIKVVIPFVILAIGIFLIGTSYYKQLWDENTLPFNLNAFGVGVSVIAIGLVFLFSFHPHSHSREEGELKIIENRLNKKVNELSDYTNKVEHTLGECKNLIEKYNKLREQGGEKTKDS